MFVISKLMKKLLLLLFIPLFFSCGNNEKEVDLKSIDPLEFYIEKPHGWHSVEMNATENLKSRANQLELDEDEIEKIIEDDLNKGTLPLFTYLKYETESINPTINVTLDKSRNMNFQDLKNLTKNDLKMIEEVFNNVEVISDTKEIDIAGFKSIYYVVKYDLTFENRIYKTRISTYFVPIKNYYYTIYLIDFIEFDDCSIVYNDVLKSIIIEK